MDPIDIFGILFVAINYLVLLPLIIYYVHQFEKKSRNPIIKFRNKNLTYMLNVAVFFILLIERPLQLMYRVWQIIDQSTMYVVQLLAIMVLCAVLILFATKVYNLYFKLQYNLSIVDISWRQNINPNDTNWYIAHKNTFGNPMYLVKWCSVPFLLFLIIETIQIFTIGEGPLFVLMHVIIVVTSLIISIVTYWKVRSFDDEYHIRQEILYQFIAIGIGVTLYIIINISLGGRNFRLQWLLITYATHILLTPLSLSSVLYPLHLVKQMENENRLFASQTAGETQRHSKNIRKHYGIDGIKVIISDDKLFKPFMHYLVNSFSCENLLFIVELIQIKVAFQTKNNNIVRIPKNCILSQEEKDEKKEEYVVIDFNKEKDKNYTIILHRNMYGSLVLKSMNDTNEIDPNSTSDIIKTVKLCLAPNLPQTVILDKYNNLCEQFTQLYCKYIKTNAELALNISHQTQNKLVEFFEFKIDKISNDKYFKLYSVFDQSCMEILLLMGMPFQRFVQQNHCIENALNESDKYNSQQPIFFRNGASYSLLRKQYQP